MRTAITTTLISLECERHKHVHVEDRRCDQDTTWRPQPVPQRFYTSNKAAHWCSLSNLHVKCSKLSYPPPPSRRLDDSGATRCVFLIAYLEQLGHVLAVGTSDSMHPFSILAFAIFVAGYTTARWDLVTRLYELAIFAWEYGVIVRLYAQDTWWSHDSVLLLTCDMYVSLVPRC